MYWSLCWGSLCGSRWSWWFWSRLNSCDINFSKVELPRSGSNSGLDIDPIWRSAEFATFLSLHSITSLFSIGCQARRGTLGRLKISPLSMGINCSTRNSQHRRNSWCCKYCWRMLENWIRSIGELRISSGILAWDACDEVDSLDDEIGISALDEKTISACDAWVAWAALVAWVAWYAGAIAVGSSLWTLPEALVHTTELVSLDTSSLLVGNFARGSIGAVNSEGRSESGSEEDLDSAIALIGDGGEVIVGKTWTVVVCPETVAGVVTKAWVEG